MKKSSNTLIPSLLRQLRESNNLSVEQVSNLLNSKYQFVVSPKTIYGYENGVSVPKVPVFLALCTIYGVKDPAHEFGYSNVKVPLTSEDWSLDQYNDFFNSPLLDKLYLLIKNGVPSFENYQDKLDNLFPDDATVANYNRLYNLFSSLDESKQGVALFLLEELSHGHHPNITKSELDIIRSLRLVPPDCLDAFSEYLSKLTPTGLMKIVEDAEVLSTSPKYEKSAEKPQDKAM